MGLNQTPAGERIHIGFFGRRNAGKSSLLNAVTGQEMAVVSEVKGTTTDPVFKTMELLPLGPVMLIDTPGIDDEGELGSLRVKKSRQVLNKVDLAVLVVDGTVGETSEDREMLDLFQAKQVPYVVVYHKADLLIGEGKKADGKLAEGKEADRKRAEGKKADRKRAEGMDSGGKEAEEKESEEKMDLGGKKAGEKKTHRQEQRVLYVSSRTGTGVEELKNCLAAMGKKEEDKDLLAGLVSPGDVVILVTPIDKAAPKGRLILPQQQTIRALLDHGCTCVVTRETELFHTLQGLGKKPSLVITDSQAFGMVSKLVPEDMLLTSFSILFARYKGDLRQAVEGVCALREIQDSDRILISEGCTHHRQCNDIGTVKLPAWIRSFTGKNPEFVYTSGAGFEEDLTRFKLVVHCGACMLNEREMKYRLACARDQGVAMTNYGILIAFVHGILERSLEPFPDVAEVLCSSFGLRG